MQTVKMICKIETISTLNKCLNVLFSFENATSHILLVKAQIKYIIDKIILILN